MKQRQPGPRFVTPSAMKAQYRPLIKRFAPWVAGVFCAAVALLCFLGAAMGLNGSPTFDYRIASDGQSLAVSLHIQTPLFFEADSVALFLGGKSVEVLFCADEKNNTLYAPITDDWIEVPLRRGGETVLSYRSALAVPGKHGNRGGAGADVVFFDGGQAVLLPEAFYTYDEESLAQTVGRIGLSFDFPADWARIVPYTALVAPTWSDCYQLTNDAFVFGAFEPLASPEAAESGLRLYVPEGDSVAYQPYLSGIRALYAYFETLFGDTAQLLYHVTLFPKDEGGGVIGGAGAHALAATFDPDSKRDWQLLAHRLFHRFYDTRVPKAAAHRPPNLWLNEGLAVYYEHRSMEALPGDLKDRLAVDSERAFAMLFNRYLYMRVKDPAVYGGAPMDEAALTSEAAREFLHYTAAPLIVKAFETASIARGNAADSLLYDTLAHPIDVAEGFLFFEAAVRLLGDEAQAFVERYALDAQIPPLWQLSKAQPADETVLAGLNEMEEMMASFLRIEDPAYPVDLVSPEQLARMTADTARPAAFLPEETSRQIRAYSPVLYALLQDYYSRAERKGIPFDSPDLRYRILGTVQ